MHVDVLRAVAGLALALTLGGLPKAAIAEEAKASQRAGAQPGAVVDPLTGKRLNDALEQINAHHYAEARATLGKLNMDRLSPYEISRVEQLLAAIEQGEANYGAAREHLKKALASGGLNDQETSSAHFQIAQFYMAEDRWREGAEALKQWFATTANPNSAAYHLLGVAYYQIGDYAAALEPAQKAIDLAGGKPQENWLQLLLALRLQRGEHRLAIPLLKQLIQAAPTKKNYWLQLSAVNASLGSYEDAAVPLQLAYRAGLLTEEQDLLRLAQILFQITIPYRAGQILSQAIEQGRVKSDSKSYDLLASCWIAAREYDKAIQPLRHAADLSPNGDLYVRLAEVYVQREDWGNAASVLRLALDRGKLKNPGNAQLLMGLAIYNQNKPREARTWFQRAREHPASRSQADSWLGHIERQLESEPPDAAENGKPASS